MYSVISSLNVVIIKLFGGRSRPCGHPSIISVYQLSPYRSLNEQGTLNKTCSNNLRISLKGMGIRGISGGYPPQKRCIPWLVQCASTPRHRPQQNTGYAKHNFSTVHMLLLVSFHMCRYEPIPFNDIPIHPEFRYPTNGLAPPHYKFAEANQSEYRNLFSYHTLG